MKQRDFFLDLLRSVAILGVLISHNDQITDSFTNYVGGISWWIVLTIGTIFRSSVPLLIMISGALLLEKLLASNSKQVISRIKHRILIPYTIWFCIFIYYFQIRLGQDISLIETTYNFLTGNYYYFYFLVMIALIYYIVGVLKWSWLTKVNLWIQFTILFAFGILNYSISSWGLTLPHFISYIFAIPYFVMGWKFYKNNSTRSVLLSLTLIIIPTLVTISLYYVSVQDMANFSKSIWWTPSRAFYPWDSSNPLMICIAIGLWFLIQSIASTKIFNKTYIKRSISWLSTISFGIYLVHPIAMDLVDSHGKFAIHLATQPLIIHYIHRLTWIIIVSTLISWLFSKLPIIKKSIGL